MKKNRYAQIIVDNKHINTDILYTYIIPEDLKQVIDIGLRVFVPFGKSKGKLLEGIIINIKDDCDVADNKLKKIYSIVDYQKVLNESQIKLGLWMKEYYLSKYLDVFRSMIPSGIKAKVEKNIVLNKEKNYNEYILSDKEKKIINYLFEYKIVKLSTLKKELNISNINLVLNSLKSKELIIIDNIEKKGIKKLYEKIISINTKDYSIEQLDQLISKNAKRQREIIEYLKEKEHISQKELIKDLNIGLGSIKSLEKKGFIKIDISEINRNPIKKKYERSQKLDLNVEQKKCLFEIWKDINAPSSESETFLIHGITGSGKTEVYMQLIEKMLQKGKDSIVLVPEISLTPQTVERFVSRFGDNVAVIHSRLSQGEKYDQWRRIKESKVKIVVGARSAVFSPFNNLGLIIIDEEHESSYKSSSDPKYSTIEVAQKRCELEQAHLLLGSATPSLETYYKSKIGQIKLLEMKNRANNRRLPEVTIVDMKNELSGGNKSFLSIQLYNEIKENLEKKEQTILFLNRRGFSTFVSCRSCGYVVKCKNCDISMTYHANKNMLMCHYCGSAVKAPRICPQCGSKYIKYFGTGTEKIEEAIKKYFPKAKVARMDNDTTSKKGSHEAILERVKNNDIDILIGTQMITKGLDFPNVTLVGILAADMSLNLPDFRASERTFQLITQVSGRAGRGKRLGRVILQTYEPEHYAVLLSKKQDYVEFYNNEILIRKEFGYPPFKNIINIVLRSKNEEVVKKEVISFKQKLVYNINSKISDNKNHEIIGPVPASIYRVKGFYRWQLLIKLNDKELQLIKNIIYEEYKNYIKNKLCNEILFNIDINPYSMM